MANQCSGATLDGFLFYPFIATIKGIKENNRRYGKRNEEENPFGILNTHFSEKAFFPKDTAITHFRPFHSTLYFISLPPSQSATITNSCGLPFVQV